ncbi:MAG TPA: ATP-binding protein [Myxococcota bacterium]|jgi:signal transduction histidine kinase|nr:ATP-binding protein [Myxococcota bacterium]
MSDLHPSAALPGREGGGEGASLEPDGAPLPTSAELAAARWTALFVAVVALVAAVLLRSALMRYERAKVEHAADAAAQRAAGLIEDRLVSSYQSLRGNVEVWGRFGPRPAPEWEAEAEGFLRDHPGYQALTRLHPALGNAIAAKPPGRAMLRAIAPLMAQRVETAGEIEASRGEVAAGPFTLEDGRKVFGLQVPITYPKPLQPGVIFAVFEPAEAVARITARMIPAYSVRVSTGGVEVYGTGEPAPNTPAEWRRVQEVRPPIGPLWTIVLEPTAELVATEIGTVPDVVFVSGAVIALLLGSITYLGQLVSARARALGRANRALTQRFAEGERARAELDRLNDELEARVDERTATLEDAVAELETFNYSVSHDLRSPLGAILNFGAILSEDYRDRLDAEAQGYLRRIMTSAEAAVSMMNALLAFSRSGRDEIKKTRVDMGQLARTVADELRSSQPEYAGAEIQIGELPAAHADATMMRLVLTNLIGNAMKFSRDAADRRIEITGRSDAEETFYGVTDHGIGIDMKYTDKLFRVFERLHSSEEFEGHGVGLAIVARIVRRHGGRVACEGAPGKGATFSFVLPRA